MANNLLHELLSSQKDIYGQSFFQDKAPEIIYQNIRQDFGNRPYQKEAFGRFHFYWEEFPKRIKGSPNKLLYHMATGSGKTLIMAGLMVYLYTKGYRNFLFFVDSTNIIEKTRENFLNPNSSKYLFAQRIQVSDQQVRVKEVDNFTVANRDDINIVFTTIQGLHSRMNTPRENSITYEDFEKEKIVMISDEAHHINAETKSHYQRNKAERENIDTWEGTVSRIINANSDNVMLEFTATMDLSHAAIREKYQDRIIFDYPLKEFRLDGYSKEVQVLQADLDPIDRALQALILSQLRLKIFAEHKIAAKPVIMFKANRVNPPTERDANNLVVSSEFREKFQKTLKELTSASLKKIKDRADSNIIAEAFNYFEKHDITLDNLVLELKEDFSDDKCVSIDSTDQKEENQILVNSLEDADNPIRAVFAVDALNEGWDVLNLFDIVRLYEKRVSNNKTIAEAQLIGRGARYYPFKIEEAQPLYKRKYDVVGNQIEKELKLCEELYFHSVNNSRYISELRDAMARVGIKEKSSRQLNLQLKESFKETDTYKKGKIFTNDRVKYNREDVTELDESIRDHHYKVKLRTGYMVTTALYSDATGKDIKMGRKDYKLSEFNKQVLRKALHRLPFYHFSNLKRYFPPLKSHSEFITSKDYLSNIAVEVSGPGERISNLNPTDQLDIAVQVLEEISGKMKREFVEYKGTRRFKPYPLRDKITDKQINVANDAGSDREYGVRQSETHDANLRIPLDKKDWYAFNDNFGTSEEKKFVSYIDKVYDKLKDQYSSIFLVRNERHFKLYSFENGQAIEPDFVLFLEKSQPQKTLHYQIFIEPKGDHLIEHDQWKEDFLKKLKEEFELEEVWKGKEYIIWGMPFYNEQVRRREFEEEFENLIE